ncbi:MAG: CPBP family intramembrane metalloprotease [Anaerolineales bacterium]|nr:MAG: CPBP family intramembrane metalloprotease [Anaerolineales bacterium]
MEKTIIKKTAWFLVICFTLTYGLGLIIFLQGGLEKSSLQGFIMYIPMISAFFVQKLIAKEPLLKGGKLGFRIGKPVYLLAAPVICLSILAVIYSVTFLLNPELLVNKDTLAENIGRANIPLGNMSTMQAILMIFALNLILAPILNLPMFLGEEVGWRGFLFPNLLALFKKPGLLIGGIIWGLWHLPMILMGLNYPTNPTLGILFMVIFCVSWGIIIQFIYQASGSIFSAALAHGIINWTGTTVMLFLVEENKINMFLEGPTGIVGLIVVAPVAFYCFQIYPVDQSMMT